MSRIESLEFRLFLILFWISRDLAVTLAPRRSSTAMIFLKTKLSRSSGSASCLDTFISLSDVRSSASGVILSKACPKVILVVSSDKPVFSKKRFISDFWVSISRPGSALLLYKLS
ncbi:MAG: hypothetical protein BWY14_01332 [Parcubacteria group bacterium ADurb.Bin192]|nr:MAG: hypothetical protein BWY14_01332 [Parcubacteria group bacterium ADurb.Bin192]